MLKDYKTKKTSIMVEFSALGEDFDPSMVSKQLQLAPSQSWIKGEAINKHVDRKETCWAVSTGYQESLDVSVQFGLIMAKFEGKMEKLLELKEYYDVTYKIDVVIIIVDGQSPAVYLNGKVIAFAHRLGADIDCDLYTYT